MAKQPKKIQSKPNYSKEELGDLTTKQLGKEVGGNPTEWDYRNLWIPINNYDKAFPGRLARMARDAYMEWTLSSNREVKNHPMWMPADLMEVIEASYPSFWTNNKHKSWFTDKYPIFAKDSKVDTIPEYPGSNK